MYGGSGHPADSIQEIQRGFVDTITASHITTPDALNDNGLYVARISKMQNRT